MSNTAQEILDAVGGPGNITHFTHCATRLRFELNDASVVDKDRVEAIDGVLGAVPQSGDRYQIVIGGAVQSVFNEINNLPSMKSGAAASNDDVKAAARAKARGKNALVDAFFEYLSDSFRPLLPVLLGASLILAFLAVLDALHVVDTRADVIPAWLGYVNSMWRAVFYFLPAMVAYNASKKLDIDPWVGTAVILSLLTPNFIGLSNTSSFTETTCEKTALGAEQCVTQIGSLPLQLSDYGGQVFVPLLMVPILALVYKGLKKIIPANVQMVFVPFISFIIIMPLTAFLIGPLSIWIGNGLGVAAAFVTAFLMVVLFDYRTKEQKAEARAKKSLLEDDAPAPAPAATPAASAAAPAAAPAADAAPSFSDEAKADLTLTSPMAGTIVALSDVADEAFAAGALGPGVALSPAAGAVVVAPCDGKVTVAFPTGHAYGIKSASGVQVLIHIGMDTVKLEGRGFTPRVTKGDIVRRGDVLAEVDWDVIREAGYDTVTPMVVTNKKKFGEITPAAPGPVGITDTVVTVSPKDA